MNRGALIRGLALGRIGLGAGLLVAPRRAGGPWVGPRTAAAPGAQVAIRALGIRDLILGGMVLHVGDHPQVAPRWLATCALADAVDAASTFAVRDRLPLGARGVIALAAGAAAAGLALAAQVRQDAATPAAPSA